MRDVRLIVALALATLLPIGVAVAAEDAGEAEGREAFRLSGTPRFFVDDGEVLELSNGRRFHDTIEWRTGGAGALLINELSMDDYVTGIAEMPTHWPIEALKAQAVAARTYAWRSILRGTYTGYDICATVACQVFRGADVVLDAPSGHRWREAVAATSGEVLVEPAGFPILARYFSTSGGRTYANEDVFPSDGAFDYLVSIDDPYDAASPLHRWTARFEREQLDAVFARGTRLSVVTPFADIVRLGDTDDPLTQIRVIGRNGRQVDVGAVAFRDFVSQLSAQLFPDTFPGLRPDGERPLPATMPSSRFEVEVGDDEVIFHGRGWGHGVGMGQYGAFGRAEAGHTYDEILTAYYGGLAPVVSDEVPERIRVGMSATLPIGIGASAHLTIEDGDGLVAERVFGTWELDRDAAGWVLLAPQGHGEPLDASVTRNATGVPSMPDAVTVEIDVNKPVLLELRVSAEDGRGIVVREMGVVEAGTHAATWRFDDEDRRRVDAGDYHVMLVAEDHTGEQMGEPLRVSVPEPPRPPTPPEPPAQPDATESDGPWMLSTTTATAIGAIGLVLLFVALRRKATS